MTFCSLGELCESTFNCNIQMSYFALSGLILILFQHRALSVCGTLYVFSSFPDVMKHLWRPGQAGQAYARASGGRQPSSTRSDHKTNQRRTPSRHRQHSGTVSAAVTKLVRPKPSFCSQGTLRLDPEPEGFDVSRLIVAQGLIALHFVHFLPAHSTKVTYFFQVLGVFLLDSSILFCHFGMCDDFCRVSLLRNLFLKGKAVEKTKLWRFLLGQ